MNIAQKAVVSARAAELTTLTREKVAAAIEAPAEEREPLLIDALAAAVEAIDALTEASPRRLWDAVVTAVWHLRSKAIDEVVQAEDQWAAWDTLRDRTALDFGLIVQAEPDESGDPIPVQTAALMRRWGRDDDAAAFDQLAREAGLIA